MDVAQRAPPCGSRCRPLSAGSRLPEHHAERCTAMAGFHTSGRLSPPTGVRPQNRRTPPAAYGVATGRLHARNAQDAVMRRTRLVLPFLAIGLTAGAATTVL